MQQLKTILYEIYKAGVYIETEANRIDTTIAQCILYNMISNELTNNPSASVGNLAKSYFPTIYNQIKSEKNILASYPVMKKYIENQGKAFLEYTI